MALCTPPIFRARSVACTWRRYPAGPVSELWGWMHRLVGSGARGPIPSACANSWPARWLVPSARSSDRRWWPRSVATTLISGIAADQEFILRAALVCEPVTIKREFDTTGVGSHREPSAASLRICAGWATFIAATRSGANITCLPTRPGVLRLQQSILENVFTRMK